MRLITLNLFIIFADSHIFQYNQSDEIGIYMQSLTSHKLIVFWDVGDEVGIGHGISKRNECCPLIL